MEKDITDTVDRLIDREINANGWKATGALSLQLVQETCRASIHTSERQGGERCFVKFYRAKNMNDMDQTTYMSYIGK